MDPLVVDEVVVVDHEQEGLAEVGQPVDQCRDHRVGSAGEPGREERGLARPGRRAHQDQRDVGVDGGVEGGVESGPVHQVPGRRGRLHLGGGEARLPVLGHRRSPYGRISPG